MSRISCFRRAAISTVAVLASWLGIGPVQASDIGVSPVAVHLDKANDRATVSVVNNGAEAVVMQAEVVEWQHGPGANDSDAPTADMIVNPAVFTLAAGQTQVVRVGMRKAAQATREGTYRIVLREVPAPPKPGDVRLSGQVRVLMALRVPIYVAPLSVVRDPRWQAVAQSDGSIVASLENEGNVHVRVGRLRLRTADADVAAAPHLDRAVAEVVFPGEKRKFSLVPPGNVAGQRMLVEIATDQGPYQVPVTLAQK